MKMSQIGGERVSLLMSSGLTYCNTLLLARFVWRNMDGAVWLAIMPKGTCAMATRA